MRSVPGYAWWRYTVNLYPAGVLSGNRFYGIDFRQDFASDTNYFLPCWRYLRQVLAASGKNLNA